MLSVIIPSYKDPLLNRTIQSLLDNARGDIEIIVVIDGYELEITLPDDVRVVPITLEQNGGMRNAINIGVANSRGQYIMRTDEHCKFGEGYDVTLTEELMDNWIVVPMRYKLDVEKWKTEGKPIGYQKMIIGKWRRGKKFGSQSWPERDAERKHYPIDETMSMQGSCWVMTRVHWNNVIRSLDKAYGTLYQDSVEMIFKTWRAGGKLMLNKKTWYAHKARRFKRTHNYSDSDAIKTFEYSLGLWQDYYREVIKPRWGV